MSTMRSKYIPEASMSHTTACIPMVYMAVTVVTWDFVTDLGH